ncbi:hypothetical protein ACFO3D_11500 [Virgibacillus kekensis]|uniref:LysM domain-containing protein n=1 Tax=Virgibacillus kekensis TaxID=202261 RepID=A0ABV9DJ29_9BACI
MGSFKKAILYLFTILLLVSLYKDLTVGTSLDTPYKVGDEEATEIEGNNEMRIYSMQVKVQNGDTVLSIVERINVDLQESLNIEKILTDFTELNPTADPKNLTAGKFYSFPVYEKGTDN